MNAYIGCQWTRIDYQYPVSEEKFASFILISQSNFRNFHRIYSQEKSAQKSNQYQLCLSILFYYLFN